MTKIYILMNDEGRIEDVFDSEEKLIKQIGKEMWNNKVEYEGGYGGIIWGDDMFQLNDDRIILIGELK